MKIINGVIRNKVVFILASLLSFISISLCLFALTNNYAFREQMKGIENMFSVDTASTYVMEFTYVKDEDLFAKDINTIKEAIINKYGIPCGAYTESQSGFVELENNSTYLKCNEEVYKGTFNEHNPDIADVVTVDSNLLDFVDVGISKEMLEPMLNNGETLYPIYVGKGYKGIIKIDEILTDYYYGNKYIVKGYIDNQKWFQDSDAFEFPVSSMDYKFLTTFSDAERSDSMIQLSTMNNILLKIETEAKNREIIQMASDKNIKINIISVQQKLNDYKMRNKEIIKNQRFFAIIVLLCSILSLSTLFCTTILLHQKEYGIRLAFGESKIRLLTNMVGKNIIIILMMSVISYCVVDKMYYDRYYGISDLYRLTLRNYALPISLGVIIVFIVTSAISPGIMIFKLNLVQLIRGESE